MKNKQFNWNEWLVISFIFDYWSNNHWHPFMDSPEYATAEEAD